MGHADGVEPAFFQNPTPPLHCILIFTATKDTVVMVDAAAPEKYWLVINSQSGFGAPGEIPDPVENRLLIRIGSHQNAV